jgi:hypothetical protein
MVHANAAHGMRMVCRILCMLLLSSQAAACCWDNATNRWMLLRAGDSGFMPNMTHLQQSSVVYH